MNTLPKSITESIFTDADHYQALRSQWAHLVHDKTVSLAPAHQLLYMALQGKDWRKAFTPITNKRKLENGAFFNWQLWRALGYFNFFRYGENPWVLKRAEAFIAPFNGVVTLDMLRTVSALMPFETYQDTRHLCKAYVPGTFPFNAYVANAVQHAKAS